MYSTNPLILYFLHAGNFPNSAWAKQWQGIAKERRQANWLTSWEESSMQWKFCPNLACKALPFRQSGKPLNDRREGIWSQSCTCGTLLNLPIWRCAHTHTYTHACISSCLAATHCLALSPARKSGAAITAEEQHFWQAGQYLWASAALLHLLIWTLPLLNIPPSLQLPSEWGSSQGTWAELQGRAVLATTGAQRKESAKYPSLLVVEPDPRGTHQHRAQPARPPVGFKAAD